MINKKGHVTLSILLAIIFGIQVGFCLVKPRTETKEIEIIEVEDILVEEPTTAYEDVVVPMEVQDIAEEIPSDPEPEVPDDISEAPEPERVVYKWHAPQTGDDIPEDNDTAADPEVDPVEESDDIHDESDVVYTAWAYYYSTELAHPYRCETCNGMYDRVPLDYICPGCGCTINERHEIYPNSEIEACWIHHVLENYYICSNCSYLVYSSLETCYALCPACAAQMTSLVRYFPEPNSFWHLRGGTYMCHNCGFFTDIFKDQCPGCNCYMTGFIDETPTIPIIEEPDDISESDVTEEENGGADEHEDQGLVESHDA